MKNLFVAVATVLMSMFAFQTTSAHVPAELVKLSEGEDLGGAYLVFAGKFGGELSQSDIAKNVNLQVEGCAKGSVIYTFDLEVKHQGKTIRMEGDSDQLTEKMHALLKRLSVGDEFTFKNTKARLPKEGTVDVWAKKFIIV